MTRKQELRFVVFLWMMFEKELKQSYYLSHWKLLKLKLRQFMNEANGPNFISQKTVRAVSEEKHILTVLVASCLLTFGRIQM